MKARRALVGSALASLLVAILALPGCRPRPRAQEPAAAEAPAEEEIGAPSAASVTLFFPGGDGRLHPEIRDLPPGPEPVDRMAFALRELLAGPGDSGLLPALPEGTELGEAYLAGGGIAYVDLKAAGELSRPPWGSRQEMLAVYSLVNTVLLNVPEVERVVLMWNGRQRATFAGHVDTTRPLRGNRALVAPERAG